MSRDPLIAQVARQARSVTPDTRVGEVTEILRMNPYRVVPVVAEDELVGLATEAALLEQFLQVDAPEERAALREKRISTVMVAPTVWMSVNMRASDAAALFRKTELDVLPVVDNFQGHLRFLGLIARSDLVQDLVRPFRPPTVGGMATPLGVYLTTGNVSGGVGFAALALSGFTMFLIHLISFLAQSLIAGKVAALPLIMALPPILHTITDGVLNGGIQLFLFLLFIRLTPIAGYHAAEHQVVHALERSEPLLIENVRKMPRVHPRCGTNFVAAGLLLWIGYIFQPVLGVATLIISLLLAITYWRTVGAWIQQYLTTRPATDAQIRSGIHAANQLLHRNDLVNDKPIRPHSRLWRSGMLQIMTGFLCGYGILALAVVLSPPIHAWFHLYLRDMLPF